VGWVVEVRLVPKDKRKGQEDSYNEQPGLKGQCGKGRRRSLEEVTLDELDRSLSHERRKDIEGDQEKDKETNRFPHITI